ncbi:HTH domain-containing protein [Bacillus sp. XF8]|nr:HTH domain-containing protein [Bacillus sp. XF8]MBO1580713.1 HTH domain-containing protein [Bacillus sp. XF8]
MSKLSNCLRMIELLQARGKIQIRELAEELEVKERMIQLYKNDLEKAGVIEGKGQLYIKLNFISFLGDSPT